MVWTVWVDADACPVLVKEMLFRAALKRRFKLTLVANQVMHHPRSSLINLVQVAQGFDIADQFIVDHCQAKDLIITADIPLAADAVAKGAIALNPRGITYTDDNIKRSLSLRNHMQELREAGVVQSRTEAFNKQDLHRFAASLDKLIGRYHKA